MPGDALVLDPNLMIPQAGLGWTVNLPPTVGPGDTLTEPAASTVLLFEDDRPLGPAHSIHEDVCWNGGGAYSHWHDMLYFSTSDGSDPRQNGRQYRVYGNWQAGLQRFDAEIRSGGTDALVHASTRWDDVLQTILFINRLGIFIRPGAKILDFGCGAGKHTYRMRDFGFDCYGFDVQDYVQYRTEADRELFGFSQSTPEDGDLRIDPNLYRMPFPDNTFDVIFSFSVLEHVMDLDAAMRECARVLKPSGIVVHGYPGRYQLVEPHVCIPLASLFAPDWWVRIWSRIGARAEACRDLGWQEAAETHIRFIERGLSYRSRRQIRSISGRYFARVSVYSAKKMYLISSWDRTRTLIKAFFDPHPLRALGLAVTLLALVCGRPGSVAGDRVAQRASGPREDVAAAD